MRSLSDKPKTSMLNNPLQGWLVPSCPSQLTQQDEEAIDAAISALHELCDDIKYDYDARMAGGRNETVARNLHERILQHWDAGIHDWMAYLFHHYHPLYYGSRWTAISFVSCALLCYINTTVECGIDFYQDHPSVTLAIQLWQETDFDYMKSDYVALHGWWEPYIALILHYHLEIENEEIADIIDLIVCRLLKCNESETRNTEYNIMILSLEKMLSLDNSFGQRLRRIVRGVADVLHWAVAVHLPGHEDEHGLHLCFRLFSCIVQKLTKSNSIEALCEVLHHSVLDSVIKFRNNWKYLNDDFPEIPDGRVTARLGQNAVLVLLNHIIPQYVCFHSVLKAMKTDMEDGYVWEEPKDTMMEEAWNGLRKLCLNTALLESESENSPIISLCDNPQHGVTMIPVKYYRCSGCASALYCSKNCQKIHWDKTHRMECANIKLLYTSSMHDIVSRKDCISVLRLSIMILLVNDSKYGSQWNKVKAIAKSKYPRKKMSQLSVMMDYTKSSGMNTDVVTRDRAAVTAALATGPQATVIQCTAPLGSMIATITAAGDFSKAKTTVWFAGRSLITYIPAPVSDTP